MKLIGTFTLLVLLVLAAIYCILTVVYFPPTHHLGVQRYLVPFSVLSIISLIALWQSRRQAEDVDLKQLTRFMNWLSIWAIGYALVIHLMYFLHLTMYISDYLQPYRFPLIVLILIVCLGIAFARARKAKAQRTKVAAATYLSSLIISALVLNWATLYADRNFEIRRDYTQSEEGTLVGQQAPYLELIFTDGRRADLSAYSGKVLVVNFWATWCAPCYGSLRSLMDFAEPFVATQVQFLPVSLDSLSKNVRNELHWDIVSPIIKELEKDGMGIWTNEASAELWKPHPISSVYVIDKHGVIRFSHLGYFLYGKGTKNSFFSKLRKEISKLAEET